MATAIIILEDEPDGKVDVTLSFGTTADDESPARVMALAMVRSHLAGLADDEDPYDD